jgi:hypothetical protein
MAVATIRVLAPGTPEVGCAVMAGTSQTDWLGSRRGTTTHNFALTLRVAFGAGCPSGHAAPVRVAACGGSPHLRGAS